MAKINGAWLPVFSEFFDQKILPIDTKFVGLTGKKAYKLYRKAFYCFWKGYQLPENSDYEKYVQESLFPIANDLALNYSQALKEHLQYNDQEHHNKSSIERAYSDKNFHLAVDLLEDGLNISSRTYSPIPDTQSVGKMYITESLEKFDFSNSLLRYNRASNYLFSNYKESSPDSSRNSSLLSNTHYDPEFILFITSSEAWNCLSHFSAAYRADVYRPKLFDSNIDRALRHLDRATIDILKYLIITKKADIPKALSLRIQELSCMGDGEKYPDVLNEYFSLAGI